MILEERTSQEGHKPVTVPKTPIWVDDEPAVVVHSTPTSTTLPVEDWRDVVDWPFTDDDGVEHIAYQVSDYGNVKALQRPGMRREFLLQQWITQGRPHVNLRVRKSVTKAVRVDELVATAFLDPRPGPTWGVGYRDGDKTNVELSNLSWESGARKGRRKVAPSSKSRRRSAATSRRAETQAATPEPERISGLLGKFDVIDVSGADEDEDTQADYEIHEPEVYSVDPEVEAEVEEIVAPGLQEWHRYMLGSVEVLTTPEGTDIARLDADGEIIETVSLSAEQTTDLHFLLGRIV
jgi:hypothetical protein